MPYANRDDLNLLFGKGNIEKWADMGNRRNLSEISNKIAWALGQAESDIDDRLRDGPYVIPFADPVPNKIKDICTRLAGWHLYSARGMSDAEDGFENQLKVHLDWVEKTLSGLHLGLYTLNAPKTDYATYPKVVVQYNDDIEERIKTQQAGWTRK